MFVLLSSVLFVIVTLFVYYIIAVRRPTKYPPGPIWWPIVGNTPLLRKLAKELNGQHRVFEKWMNEYKSPVIGLKLGGEYVIIAMTYKMVREIHTRDEFIGRPDNFFLRLRTMGTRLGITCTDGQLWSEHRNFTMKHLRQVGYGRQPMEKHIHNELTELLEIIGTYDGDAIWPGEFLSSSVINVLWSLVAGERISRNDERLDKLLKLLHERSKAFDMAGGLLNQMPWLRFIVPNAIGYNLITNFNKELYELFMETIVAHKKQYSEDKSSDDLIYAYIKEIQEANTNNVETNFTEIQLIMVILDIFIAGSQTTSITLDLAFRQMVLNPKVQTQIHSEIDQKYSDKKIPILNDRLTLPYSDAVLLEIQRFYSITPITGPRRVLQETTLGGYTVPKNSTVLISLQSVHHDTEHWHDPDVFRPERFLSKDYRKIQNTDHFMPFGQGKRRCLGDSLARSCLFMFFVGIMQKYSIQLDEKCTSNLLSEDLLPGITLSPKPYKIRFKRR